jgi:hypothetical protein
MPYRRSEVATRKPWRLGFADVVLVSQWQPSTRIGVSTGDTWPFWVNPTGILYFF